MRERTQAFIWFFILLIVALTADYFILFNSSFTFYNSQITLDKNKVSETLNYNPSNSLHTLYRNFKSELTFYNNTKNSIYVENVECSSGQPYVRAFNICKNFNSNDARCLAYTENNEFGCSFGNSYGFKRDKEYSIKSDYLLYPENLFLIKGKYYIKFVAYESRNHVLLIKNKNFFTNGITRSYFFPSQNVIIYSEIDKEKFPEASIIKLNNFEFDFNKIPLIFILSLLPSFVFIISWIFLGKEKEFNIPSSLSYFPEKRKAWEVAAFFNKANSNSISNIFSSILMDFYNRKIIEIKIEKSTSFFTRDKALIKIIKIPNNLDDIEKKVMEILKSAEDSKGEYFSLNLVSVDKKREIAKKFMKLEEIVSLKKGKILTYNASLISILSVVAVSLILFFLEFYYLIFFFVNLFLITFISMATIILCKFKEDYYKEYLEWKAFRNYLKRSFSIKKGTTKTITIWKEYLIYATALGVSKNVLDQLRKDNLIQEENYNKFMLINSSSSGFYSSSVHSQSRVGRGSGGFSGGGGGGIGGGGGGGR